ncbi:MAG: hypothetical protein ACKVPJ_11355 [Chitinophagales bacterium]
MIHKIYYTTCLLLTCLLSLKTAYPQWIGGNGEGFSKTFSQEDIHWLQQLTQHNPLVIRWPGGSDAKLAFPSLYKPGLGMRTDSIYKHYAEFTDENGLVKEEALKKDLKKATADGEETESALKQLIHVSKQVKNFQVIYCLNVMTGTIESNISAIKVLFDSGVNIIAIVAGNETFYSYSYNWEKYKTDFMPILQACKKEFPSIPRLLCIAQNIKRKQHLDWNIALFDYMQTQDELINGTDVHIYLMEELKAASKLHPQKIVYEEDLCDSNLCAAFNEYISLYNADSSFTDFLKYYRKYAPGKMLFCTEFGDKPAENWLNTVANAGHTFKIFCDFRKDFNALLVHNLLGNWLWASRSPAGKFDACETWDTNINRCHGYAIQMANELPLQAEDISKEGKIKSPGTYYFYFNNAGGEKYTSNFTLNEVNIEKAELHYVTGRYTYSSAGQTGFMEKGSKPSCEVKGIDVKTFSSLPEIPANSFGYLKVEVK